MNSMSCGNKPGHIYVLIWVYLQAQFVLTDFYCYLKLQTEMEQGQNKQQMTATDATLLPAPAEEMGQKITINVHGRW